MVKALHAMINESGVDEGDIRAKIFPHTEEKRMDNHDSNTDKTGDLRNRAIVFSPNCPAGR